MAISDQMKRVDRLGIRKTGQQKYIFNQDSNRFKAIKPLNMGFHVGKISSYRYDGSFDHIENKRIGSEYTNYITPEFKSLCESNELRIFTQLSYLNGLCIPRLEIDESIPTRDPIDNTGILVAVNDYWAEILLTLPLKIEAYIKGKQFYIFMSISMYCHDRFSRENLHFSPSEYNSPYFDVPAIQKQIDLFRTGTSHDDLTKEM